MDALGLLRIRVRRGINLALRDSMSSDPYVLITCGSQKVKTSAVKNSCNPVWDDDLTLSITDLNSPITLTVYDKDTFTVDDKMGDANIDIKPYLDCLQWGLESLPDGTKVERVQPNTKNCLSDESPVIWNKGKMIQDMKLKLRNVDHGELKLRKVDVQIEWIDLPGLKALKS